MIHGTTKRNVPLGRLGSDGAPAVHRAQDEADKPAGDEQGLQTTLSRPVEKREAKTPGRMRRGVKTTTNTAKRSPKRVAILKRQREVLAYREMGHSYDKIAAALGISDSQVERDLIAAMDAIIREPAERVFAIDMRRLDEMLAGHYDAACNGDPTATAACLRIIEMRGRMLGFFDHERRARLNLNITEGGPGGDAGGRSLSLEFVLPSGQRFGALDALDQPSPTSSQPRQPPGSTSGQPPLRIKPEPTDITIERADRQPSAFAKRRGSWMD
jgi:hypothetical protein